MYSAILRALSVLLIPLTLGAQDLPVQDRARLGISLARQGNLTDAEQHLRAAVSGAPSVAIYRAQLASILGLQGKWNEALAYFEQAVQLAPDNLDFRRETAAVQWQLGLMPAAENNLRYVLSNRPSDSGAILLLGLLKEKTGDYAKAAELLDSQFEMVAAQPERTVALFHSVVQSRQLDKTAKIVDVLKLHRNDKIWADAIRRCTQIALMGDLPTAEALFSLLPADDPERPVAAFYLARRLYQESQVSQAKELLLQLKTQGVVNADVEALLGNCLESERQPEHAIAAYRRAIAADPSRIDHYEDLISLLLYTRRTGDARVAVGQALTAAPNDARAWVWKGNVELRRNAYKDAMESYRHAVRLDDGNADARFGVAAAYYVTGQIDAAILECKAGISRFPNDARFYVSYAEMLLASPDSMEQHTQTNDLLERALKLSPQSAQAHYLLGQMALQEGRLKEAEERLLLSLQSDPDRSKTHFALAGVYRRTGRADKAAQEFVLYQKLKESEESGSTAALTLPETQ